MSRLAVTAAIFAVLAVVFVLLLWWNHWDLLGGVAFHGNP